MPKPDDKGAQPGENPGGNPNPQGNGEAGDKGKPPVDDEKAGLLKEVMEYKKQLRAFQDKAQKDQENQLKEQGQFKELAEKETQKAGKLERALKLAELKAYASQFGIIDLDLVTLASLEKVSFDSDSGMVSGAKEAMEALKEAKPHLFAGSTETPGGNPGEKVNPPKPAGKSGAVAGPQTLEEWEKMPPSDKNDWANKNPDAFKALCDASKQKSMFRF